jgi:hypothetical protein
VRGGGAAPPWVRRGADDRGGRDAFQMQWGRPPFEPPSLEVGGLGEVYAALRAVAPARVAELQRGVARVRRHFIYSTRLSVRVEERAGTMQRQRRGRVMSHQAEGGGGGGSDEGGEGLGGGMSYVFNKSRASATDLIFEQMLWWAGADVADEE